MVSAPRAKDARAGNRNVIKHEQDFNLHVRDP